MTWIATLLLALIFGAWFDNAAGFAAGALLGFLLGQVLELRRRLVVLEERSRTPAPRPQAAAAASTAPTPPEPEPEPRTETPPVPPVAQAPKPTVESPWREAPPAGPSMAEQWITKGMDWLRQGNPLAKVGIVVLFFGGAFLAKYAAEHSLFPLEMRLAALAAGAVALLVTGWRLRARKALYAQILQGGGIAGFYLTVFAAARLYQLLPLSAALFLLVAIALAGAVLAVAQESLALAVIGFAGGFLAPVLLSTGGGSHVALFSYYTVLNLGVFAVAWFRAWRVLNLIGFLFTFSITGAWRAMAYRPEHLVSADFFLLLFFVMYVGVSVLFALRQPPRLRGYVSASLVFGLPVVVFSLQASLLRSIEYGLAFSALGFGLFYLSLAWVLFRSRIDNLRLLTEAFAALGVVFASLAIPLAFDRQTTAAMWAVEGAGLLWIGVRQERRLPRAFGALLQVFAALSFVASLPGPQPAHAFLNGIYSGTVLLAGSALLSGLWLFRHRDHAAAYENHWDKAAALWGLTWWLLGGLREIHRFFPEQAAGTALCGIASSSVLLLLAGSRLQWPLLPRMALALPVLAAAYGIVLDIPAGHPAARLGYLGWPALIAATAWMLRRQDSGAATPQNLSSWLHAGLLWLLALLCAWESGWHLKELSVGIWRQLPWGVVPALLLALLSRRPLLPAWPVAAHADLYLTRGAAPLAGYAIFWIAAVNLTQDGSTGGLPYYLPLLNPLDVSCALACTALALYWMALAPNQRARIWPLDTHKLAWGMAGLIFLWLSAALLRALHHLAGTPLDLRGVLHSTLAQSALSIFWGLAGVAVILVASRRGQRPLWLAGAALMGVVVAKLFLLDLSGTGTLARIVSFMTVGGLLLLTGYLSPLPPRREPAGSAS